MTLLGYNRFVPEKYMQLFVTLINWPTIADKEDENIELICYFYLNLSCKFNYIHKNLIFFWSH